jgi:hypothetical protein
LTYQVARDFFLRVICDVQRRPNQRRSLLVWPFEHLEELPGSRLAEDGDR